MSKLSLTGALVATLVLAGCNVEDVSDAIINTDESQEETESEDSGIDQDDVSESGDSSDDGDFNDGDESTDTGDNESTENDTGAGDGSSGDGGSTENDTDAGDGSSGDSESVTDSGSNDGDESTDTGDNESTQNDTDAGDGSSGDGGSTENDTDAGDGSSGDSEPETDSGSNDGDESTDTGDNESTQNDTDAGDGSSGDGGSTENDTDVGDGSSGDSESETDSGSNDGVTDTGDGTSDQDSGSTDGNLDSQEEFADHFSTWVNYAGFAWSRDNGDALWFDPGTSGAAVALLPNESAWVESRFEGPATDDGSHHPVAVFGGIGNNSEDFDLKVYVSDQQTLGHADERVYLGEDAIVQLPKGGPWFVRWEVSANTDVTINFEPISSIERINYLNVDWGIQDSLTNTYHDEEMFNLVKGLAFSNVYGDQAIATVIWNLIASGCTSGSVINGTTGNTTTSEFDDCALTADLGEGDTFEVTVNSGSIERTGGYSYAEAQEDYPFVSTAYPNMPGGVRYVVNDLQLTLPFSYEDEFMDEDNGIVAAVYEGANRLSLSADYAVFDDGASESELIVIQQFETQEKESTTTVIALDSNEQLDQYTTPAGPIVRRFENFSAYTNVSKEVSFTGQFGWDYEANSPVSGDYQTRVTQVAVKTHEPVVPVTFEGVDVQGFRSLDLEVSATDGNGTVRYDLGFNDASTQVLSITRNGILINDFIVPDPFNECGEDSAIAGDELAEQVRVYFCNLLIDDEE